MFFIIQQTTNRSLIVPYLVSPCPYPNHMDTCICLFDINYFMLRWRATPKIKWKKGPKEKKIIGQATCDPHSLKYLQKVTESYLQEFTFLYIWFFISFNFFIKLLKNLIIKIQIMVRNLNNLYETIYSNSLLSPLLPKILCIKWFNCNNFIIIAKIYLWSDNKKIPKFI